LRRVVAVTVSGVTECLGEKDHFDKDN